MSCFRSLAIGVLAVGLAGPATLACGSGEMEANHQDDGQNAADEPGAEVSETHVVVEFSPARHVYDVGATVTPTAEVYDGERLLEDATLQWSASPADAVDRDDRDWAIQRADTIRFEACVIDEDGETTSECGARQLVSTNDEHSIVIESPTPGEHFEGTDDETIPVEGHVGKGLSAAAVHVNGQPAELDEQGQFSYELTPEFGLNPVVVEAHDGATDEDSVARTNAMWAPEFRAADTDDGISASFSEALLVNLGQQFFDDGTPYTEISDTEVVTEDIADMFELLLEHLDITSEIPDPVVDNDALTLHIDDVLTDETTVDIWTTDDGLEIFGQLTDLEARTEGSLSLSEETVDLDGEVFATASLFVRLDVDKPGADDDFEAELQEFELTVEDASPNFEDDQANAIFEVADSMLRTELEDIILDSLDTSFIDNLPDMLLEMLESLEEEMASEQLEIDMDFGEPIEASFSGEIGEFSPVWGEGLHGVLDAQVELDAPAHYPDNPGVAVLEPGANESPLFADSRVQFGIDLTVLNTMFHSLWNAGLLDIEITDMVPESVEGLIDEGHAEGLMPPVLVEADGSRDDDLGLQLGQLEIDLDWMDQNDRFGVNVRTGADLSIVGEQITIDLSDEFDIDVWLIESSEDEPVMEADEVRDLLRSIILPELEGEIDDNLAFAVPMPELDILEGYAADLAGMSLEVRMNRAPDVRNGFLMFDATLEGEHILE